MQHLEWIYSHLRLACFPGLANNDDVKCNIIDGTGYFSWKSDLWVGIVTFNLNDDHIVYNKYCPFDYCQKGHKRVNMMNRP